MDDTTFKTFLIANQIDIGKSSITCVTCNNWLTPPIRVTDFGNYCGQCAKENGVRNAALEDLLNNYKYPCFEESCENLANYSNIIQHAQDCNKHTTCTFCEAGCDKRSIFKHLVTEHKAQLIEIDKPKFVLTINLPLTNVDKHLIKMSKLQFLFSYEQEKNVLKGKLTLLNNDMISGIDKYTIHMTTNLGRATSHEGVLQLFGEKYSANNDIVMYLDKADSCELEICLGPRKRIDAIKCPICLHAIDSKFRQCNNGHNVCEDCGSKINACPICRMKIGDQIINVQYLYPDKAVMTPCKNHKSGCMAYFVDQKITNHLDVCEFQNVKCCACALRIRKCDLITHMTKNHALKNNYYTLRDADLSLKKKVTLTAFIAFDSEIFQCVVYSDGVNVVFTCKMAIQERQNSHKYRSEFHIITDENLTKAASIVNNIVCANINIHRGAWYTLGHFKSPFSVRCCIFKDNSLAAVPCINLTRVFFDISRNLQPLGRLVIELRSDIVPKTATNFSALCTNERGYGYKGSHLRITQDNYLEGGVIANHNCGNCNYRFAPENKFVKYCSPGMLAMSDTSRSCSEFRIITSEQAPAWLSDSKYILFGQIVDGLEVLKKLNCAVPDIFGRTSFHIFDNVCIDYSGKC